MLPAKMSKLTARLALELQYHNIHPKAKQNETCLPLWENDCVQKDQIQGCPATGHDDQDPQVPVTQSAARLVSSLSLQGDRR